MARLDKEIRDQLFDPAPKSGRRMSAKSQIAFIKKALKKKGIEPDLVDVEALVDPELNYRENYANIMIQLAATGKVAGREEGILDNPACQNVKTIKEHIRLTEDEAGIKAAKERLKDEKTMCQCSQCQQMGLYDPGKVLGMTKQKSWERELKKKAGEGKKIRGQQSLTGGASASRRLSEYEVPQKVFDPAPRKHGLGRPPKKWFYAMYQSIKKSSDVRDPGVVVASIWRRLSPGKRAQIKAREVRGEQFKYDLPLPEDHSTKGAGTIRTVKPFNLAEVQANVNPSSFSRLKRSGLFQTMKRQDGSTALVKRCKTARGNCNIFVDVIK